MNKIRFGTDGWRGIIAEDFTFQNVKRAAHAVSLYMGRGAKAAVGYDTRFMSGRFAAAAASVLKIDGVYAVLSASPVPTPVLSYFVKDKGLDGGIMITASHNPYIYNGLKFKEAPGCSALPDTTKRIERLIGGEYKKDCTDDIEKRDMSGPYVRALKRYISSGRMNRRRLSIVVDSMYGAGGFYLESILKGYGHRAVTIHGRPNPLFPGINPEPIERHLKELSSMVKKTGADIGIATDGDADRVGIVDNNGVVITPHYVLALLFLHLVKTRGWSGSAAKSISSTSLINEIAKKYNRKVIETSIGFKHIAGLMLKEDILIGGEESGGNGFKNHIPERDGLLSGLLMTELICGAGKGLSRLIKDMESEFGRYRYKRVDVRLGEKSVLYDPVSVSKRKTIAGYRICSVKTFDGVKLILDDGAWLLIRRSGTEPLLRIYAEAHSERKVSALITAAKKLI